jgi:transposase
LIPYEAPQGRRVNVIGAYISHGVDAGLFRFATYAALPKSRAKQPRPLAEQAAAHGLREEEVGPIDSERFLQFVWAFAGRPALYAADWLRERPLAIWLDNYSVHRSDRVQAEIPLLERAGITLHYLPSYSPELSKIEPIWQDVKHHDMRERSHTEVRALKEATEAALTPESSRTPRRPRQNSGFTPSGCLARRQSRPPWRAGRWGRRGGRGSCSSGWRRRAALRPAW